MERRVNREERLRVAVVGCGAVTELFHLPVLSGNPQVELALLVDRDLDRARGLAGRYGNIPVSDSITGVSEHADLAVVAVPHHLHAEIGLELIGRGVHVLIEKPMAASAAECEELTKASSERGVMLAVGMQKRFSNAGRLAKDWFSAGLLGRVLRFDLREGAQYGWPVRDPRMFTPKMGGGVVTGSGIHSLDLLLWWLGDADSIEYYDDAFGGVEADCEFHLHLGCGAQGVLEFSRTRNLRNSWVFECEHGVLEIGTGLDAPVSVRSSAHGPAMMGQAPSENDVAETPWVHLHRQLDDVIAAVRDGRSPLVDGHEGSRAVALYESARRLRLPLSLPWMLPRELDGTMYEVQRNVVANA